MTNADSRTVEEILELLIAEGQGGMGQVFTTLLNVAMRLEREQFLQAGHYQRSDQRVGYANGVKHKKIDTPAGTLSVDIPKTRGTDEPFYPQALERGCRSSRALQLTVAQMYVSGVSTRDVEKVMHTLGLESLSSSQVSRAAKLLDEDLEAWRCRPLGKVPYLILDARYEKVRLGGIVRDAVVLSALGVERDGNRHVLGVSVALSEAEVHWREFLQSLVERGLKGVQFIVSDDHAGLKAARRAVFGGTPWQRCQYHLAENAIHHAPNLEVKKTIGSQLRRVWNAETIEQANDELHRLIKHYRDANQTGLATWLENNIPEGLTVFQLPEKHRVKMRTSNAIERAVQQEIKRRTAKIRIFPNEQSLLRLVCAILIEIDEKWTMARERYIIWNADDV